MALSVGDQIRYWGAGLAVLVAAMWLLGDILLPFLAGAALAYFLDPVADRLEARGIPRVLAAIIITVLMVSAFVAVLLILIPSLINQLRALLEQAPLWFDAIRGFIEKNFPEQLEPGAPLDQGLALVRARAQEWSVTALRSAWTGGLALVDFLYILIVTPVVAF
jgi:predicted PurR-regulated permease PerM